MIYFRFSLFLLTGLIGWGCSQGASDKEPLFEPRISKEASKILENGPVRGFTMVMHATDYEYDYSPHLKEIAATGAPWISITIPFFQNDNFEKFINIPPLDHPFWAQLELTVKQAKSFGLKVVLFPIVLLRNRGLNFWRGTIRPDDYDSWYKSYESLMTILAQLASRTHTEMLSIGSEFCTLEKATNRWLNIIKVIRESYTGALMYSVNWDSIEQIQFQDDLDFLGLTGYFKLTDKKNPSVEELVASWQINKDSILKWEQIKNVPFLFSELGYTSQDGTNMQPWDYTIEDVLDLEEQKDCYTAFTEVWEEEKALYGVFFYEWCGEPSKDIYRYTPRGKPALEVAKKWFDTPKMPPEIKNTAGQTEQELPFSSTGEKVEMQTGE